MNLIINPRPRHTYYLSTIGFKRNKNKEYLSRYAAEQAMYKLVGKNNLTLDKIYNDKHEKTYIYLNGNYETIRFFIHRV